MRILLISVLLFLFQITFATQDPLTVNLKNPEYKNGTISTHFGGVVSSPHLRVQAKHIIYTNKVEKGEMVHQLFAEGDLMLEHSGNTYVGRRLEYDFISKTGIVYEGATSIGLWFLGGEKICLNRDRSFYLYNAFITTSESQTSDWKIQARDMKIDRENVLSTKNVTFRFYDTPIFWLPSFKSHLKPLSESPVRYRVEWDKGLFPKFSMRYCIHSWEFLDLFFRLNIRPSRGGGGAFESNYLSPNKQTKCQTRSYVDYDAFYRDTNPDRSRFHFRLQGLYTALSKDRHSQMYLSYDKLSDRNMQSDFKYPDFEVSTIKETILKIRNEQDWMILGINARPRINSFQGFKQELPASFWTPHPFILGNTGIISENRLKVSYLDYVLAKDLKSAVPDFHSARLETHVELYRPFIYKGLNVTPLIGLTGIFYNKSQNGGESIGQIALKDELFLNLTLRRHYLSFCHIIEPYIHYKGLTQPTVSPDTPYIFGIDDGLNRLCQLQSGIRHLFYLKKYPLFEPNFIVDFYLYAFFLDDTFKKTIPKICGTVTWNFPSISLTSRIGWNVEKQLLDFANVALAWTVNQNIAFKTELRHRSRFHWRHCNPENYIMEITRSIPHLLDSPLSDRRETLLNRFEIKMAPRWRVRLESHIGWGRLDEPHYHEIKLELITLISTGWKLRLNFIHSPAPHKKNDRFTFSFFISKK